MATATAKRTKRGGGPDRGDHLRRSLPALGGGQLEGVRPRLLQGPQGLGGAQRDPAQVGALDLLDVLLRRGLRHRQPLPLHRRGADRGAEVLPRHTAGRRGPPLGLLPPLLQGGDRRRRHRSARRSPTREPQLGWGYRNVFDRLDRMGEELRKDKSLPKFAQAIALYHMVVEATLAQPGQHFIEDYFTKSGTMPGFSEGMHNVSRDEQRHIGFGVKTLSECFRESDECKAAVVEMLREVMPYSLAVFVPPGWDLEYTRCYGFELEDIYAFGMRSVEAKWRAAGYPIEEMPSDVYPFDLSMPHEETRAARRSCCSMRACAAASRCRTRTPRPEVQQLLLRRHRPLGARRARSTARRLTSSGASSDADPWYLRIDNGNSDAVHGRGTRRRPHARDQVGRLDRHVGPWNRPAAGDAPAQAAAPGLAAHAVADAADLPPRGLDHSSPADATLVGSGAAPQAAGGVRKAVAAGRAGASPRPART